MTAHRIYSIFLLIIFLNTTTYAKEQRIDVNRLAGKSITLKHHQNDLSLEYVGLHFENPQKIRYKYKMVGIHDNWIDAGTKRIARFPNLPKGNYTFLVKAANADGIWSDEAAFVNIKVLPPWYWNWGSKMTYLLFISIGLYGIYMLQLKRQLTLAETLRLKELDQVKSKLYTNISHEFRTPLTVIQGMAGQIEGNKKAKAAIERSSINLLNLVNQMLDLSKLETGNMTINMVNDDVIKYLSYLMESFQSFALSKNIRLHFLPQLKSFEMDYDADKLMKIVANLISNAIKFTEAGGDVYVLVSTDELVRDKPEWKKKISRLRGDNEILFIQVRDTGIGIPKDELEHVFDRFYQADTSSTRQADGTGIGLAYANELVKFLSGSIDVESEIGTGSTLTVLLPVTREAVGEYADPMVDVPHCLDLRSMEI